jgi:dCTP deaminase
VRAEREATDEQHQDQRSGRSADTPAPLLETPTPPVALVRVDRLEDLQKRGNAIAVSALWNNRGMVLSDRTIRRLLGEGRIEIDPYDESLLQPSSLDVRVDRYFRVFRNSRYPYIDVREQQEDLTEFVLGSTLERVRLPDDLVARLEGKSSLGRLGLLIHSTAGFIDPGWDGHVTLELSNVANLPITIYYGMKIGQLSFVQLSEPAEKPYGSDALGSKYQGQKGPTPSRYWKNFAQ